MSALDVHAKNILLIYFFPVTIVLTLVVAVLPKLIKKYIYKVYTIYFNSLQSHRAQILKQINVEDKPVKILELRLNQGENLDFYPDSSEIFVLTATEEQAVTALQSKCCNYAKVEPRLRNLKHFDDREIDIVVGTSALCRCENQSRLLAEIHRVLAPNGKYIFIEHTNSKELNPLAYVVKELASMLAQYWFFDMCHLNSEPTEPMKKAGFRILHMREVTIESDVRMLKLIQNHVMGVAIK